MSDLVEAKIDYWSSAYPPSIQAGIPKLSERPQGWSRHRLGELLQRIDRPARLVDSDTYQLVTAKRNRGGIVAREVLRGDHIRTKTQFYIAVGDFLISNRQISHGACGIVPHNLDGALVSNEYTAFHTTDLLNLNFLSALSHSVYFQQTCFHSSIGVHVEKLVFRLEDWMRWEFDVPPLDQQRRIVAVLDTWDCAINQTERLIAAKRRRKTAIVGRALAANGKTRGFIRDFADVNPRNRRVSDDTLVSFVAMQDVSEHGELVAKTDRIRGELGNGFTQFVDGDVLVAKITPCFENGKGALAGGLTNGAGFGTTEFHVLRPHDPADADYVHQITMTRGFRVAGERHMTGSAGQRRVPAAFIEDFPLIMLGADTRRRVGGLLAMLDTDVSGLEKTASRLRAQKRGLMHKLLAGEWPLDSRFDAAPPAPFMMAGAAA